MFLSFYNLKTYLNFLDNIKTSLRLKNKSKFPEFPKNFLQYENSLSVWQPCHILRAVI